MAELADALDSGSSEGNFMQVQVLLSAPVKFQLSKLECLRIKRELLPQAKVPF